MILPRARRPAGASAILRRKQDSSFFEKKEAKKLLIPGAVLLPAQSSFRSSAIYVPKHQK
jgi:hypothetical protein